jgi:hypothetical protein
MDSKTEKALERLRELRGDAHERRPNVRALAAFAANSQCSLATVGFAARVDFDRLLVGTQYAVPFGQSPFAFRRGNTFEERLRGKDQKHGPIFDLISETLKYDTRDAKSESVRHGFAKSQEGMRQRAEKTESLLRNIIEKRPGAPNLIDGAVFMREVGGVPAYFEADAVAAHFNTPIHAGEIKSFPTVDGQADPDKVGAAIAQVSIYILLMRELVVKLGGTPGSVSNQALLITPRNTGLQPTMSVKLVGREVDRAGRILAQAPSAADIADSLESDLPSFDRVAKGEEASRVDAANELAEKVGTRFGPSCLGSCGMSRLCRDRAQRAGEPIRFGPQLVRLLPNVESIVRASELAHGAKPGANEAPVAEQLVRAERLRAKALSTLAPPAPARKAAS